MKTIIINTKPGRGEDLFLNEILRGSLYQTYNYIIESYDDISSLLNCVFHKFLVINDLPTSELYKIKNHSSSKNYLDNFNKFINDLRNFYKNFKSGTKIIIFVFNKYDSNDLYYFKLILDFIIDDKRTHVLK